MEKKNLLTVREGTVFRSIFLVSGDDIFGGSVVSGFDVFRGKDFNWKISVGSRATAEIAVLVFPGSDSSVDFDIELAGQGAECRMSGLYLCPDSENVSMNIMISHNVPCCASRQLFKGIVSGTARAGFHGRIVVAPDAGKTEAYQENHNLLLSDYARVDALPQLEIYADDVICSHGATTGKLDMDAQFYMRSRGIPEQEARVLQMQSFISPVLDFMPEGQERDSLYAIVGHAIRYGF